MPPSSQNSQLEKQEKKQVYSQNPHPPAGPVCASLSFSRPQPRRKVSVVHTQRASKSSRDARSNPGLGRLHWNGGAAATAEATAGVSSKASNLFFLQTKKRASAQHSPPSQSLPSLRERVRNAQCATWTSPEREDRGPELAKSDLFSGRAAAPHLLLVPLALARQKHPSNQVPCSLPPRKAKPLPFCLFLSLSLLSRE